MYAEICCYCEEAIPIESNQLLQVCKTLLLLQDCNLISTYMQKSAVIVKRQCLYIECNLIITCMQKSIAIAKTVI